MVKDGDWMNHRLDRLSIESKVKKKKNHERRWTSQNHRVKKVMFARLLTMSRM